MSDVSQGPGWWQASDGKWYPPKEAEKPPKPGWWLASDGKWYPPKEAEKPPKPGWWLAADGKWYPPQNAATPATAPQAKAAPGSPAKPAAKAPAKPPAGQPAAAGKAPAKGAGKPAAKAPAKAASGKGQPGPAKAVPAKAAKGKPAGAKPAAKPAAQAGDNGDDAVRRASFGLSPEEQIRIRDEQSKRDAQVLAGARAKAATRALGTLQDLIDREKATQGRELRPSPAMERAASTPPPAAAPPKAPAAAPAAKTAAPAPTAKTAPPKATSAKPAKQAKPAAAASPVAPAPQAPATPAAPAAAAPGESPLLEVKPSPLFSDTEHIGERLVIFNDRVELHDRNDRVLQVIAGPDIADVVVSKKFTGSTVTVEAGTGEVIVAKGLKPDQADEIRAIILKRTRQGAPEDKASASAGAPRPAAGAKPRGAAPRVNEADLLAKLTDLHRAGVLSDDEFEDKKALVGRLARGESLAATPTGS